MSMRYYPLEGEYGPHYEGESFGEFLDVPANSEEEDDNNSTEITENTDEQDIGFVTIGLFSNEKPRGKTWQLKSARMLEGFLYGEVDQEGKFTGDEITFIYPDLLTGLHGKFVDGEIQEARAVDIVAERCQEGIKEIKLKFNTRDNTVWRVADSESLMRSFARTVEPHERKSVYIGKSRVDGDTEVTGEGIFARRLFLPGDLVTYFAGVKTTEDEMFHDNMTELEEYEASRYYFGLYDNAPLMWNLEKDIVLDIPSEYRELANFRTTLGHKVNHKFSEEANGKFDVVKHPLFGVIVAITATEVIEEDEEVFVDYNYTLEPGSPTWFKEAHKKFQERY